MVRGRRPNSRRLGFLPVVSGSFTVPSDRRASVLLSPTQSKEATPLLLSPFVFPGQTGYLEAAADQLGQPELARAAGHLLAVTALANLCAQATRANPADVAPILAKAGEFRDQLAIALEAADAMLADVELNALIASETPLSETPASDESAPNPTPPRSKGRRT